jgi:hypothetical protein
LLRDPPLPGLGSGDAHAWKQLRSVLTPSFRTATIRHAFERKSAVKGLVPVGQEFSVSPGNLRAGSQDVSELLNRGLLIAQDAVEALAGMAGATGHVGLASALTGAAGQGARTFWVVGTAYQHVSASLITASETYSNAERSIAARAAAIFGERG